MTTEAREPKAWIVPVWTKRLDETDRPMLVCYIAGFAVAQDAVEAVKKHIEALEGDDVRAPSPVSDATADALRVTPGAIWMM